MQLPEQETKDFFRLYWGLLIYANSELGLHFRIKDLESVKELGSEGLFEIAQAMYKDKGLIGKFCSENPYQLSSEDIETVGRWKDFIDGRFVVCKYSKANATFLHEDEEDVKAYGVLALNTPFQDIIGESLPVMVDTVLLPFHGRIICHGLIAPYNIFFGPGYRRSIRASLEKALSEHGLVTTLDVTASLAPSSKARLERYLKTEANRLEFRKEIWDIISKDKALEDLYHQKMGHVAARELRKRFKNSGISGGWFAVLDGLAIAGGKDHRTVKEIGESLVQKERWGHIFYFELKG